MRRTEGKRQLGRTRCRWEDSKIVLGEIGRVVFFGFI
jgi:hypothetical protein